MQSKHWCWSFCLLVLLISCQDPLSEFKREIPNLVKLGTIDLDVVESTPVVFHNQLYRFEYIRENHYQNRSGNSYFRFVHLPEGDTTPAFAHAYHLGSAFVWGDSVYVTAVPGWGADKIDLFVSADLVNWSHRPVVDLPGRQLFNTSICRNDQGFILMYETGDPVNQTGLKFYAQFASSDNLVTWTTGQDNLVFKQNYYAAPHAIRYFSGFYYLFYLKAVWGGKYETRISRSSDLVNWTLHGRKAVLAASDEDKRLHSDAFAPFQVEIIQTAVNRNNSDLDFCFYQGKLIIFYSWGDQQGTEFLAEAYFEGTEEEFCEGWFR